MDKFLNKNNFVGNKQAVIMECDDKQVLRSMSYSKMNEICDCLVEFLNLNQSCVGLFMSHNIYLPSILISLYRMKSPFIFLKDLSTSIGYNYVLSFEQINCDLFTKINEVKLESSTLYLWEKSIKTREYADKDYIFCVIQSSGTTGKNKVIRVPISCIEDNSMHLSKLFKITNNDNIFWGTPLTFDPSLLEFLIAIENVSTLIIVPPKTYLNSNNLFKALFTLKTKEYNGISLLQIVPSVFNRWSENQIQFILKSQLRILAFGGEYFPKNILEYKKNNVELYNLYGISEVSCWATVNKVTSTNIEDDISIGKNIGDTITEIRNENGAILQDGIGEIFIGSKTRFCLINDENMTNKEIFRNTGDLGRITNNNIYYLGRKNNTIKRFGLKINLEEIEILIMKEIHVRNKCIFITKENKIVCFINIPNFEESVKIKTVDKIRVKLLKILPKEFYPDCIDIINKLPINKHGKIDLKSLDNIYHNNIKDQLIENDPSDIFIFIVSKYLGMDVNITKIQDYTFVELGGNSINVIQVLNELEKYFGSQPKEKLTNLMFEAPLNQNIEFVKTLNILKRKSTSLKTTNLNIKRIKTDFKLKISWKYNLKACVDGTPLIFNFKNETYIAIGSFSNIFAVLNISGQKIFDLTLGDDIEATPQFSEKYKLLYIGCFDGLMYGISIKDKAVKWTFKTEERIKSQPCFCMENNALVFGSYDGFVYCVDSLNGNLLWKQTISEPVACNPICQQEKIYLTLIKGSFIALEEKTGKILWTYSLKSPIFGSPSIIESKIMLASVTGVIHCLTNTGEPLCNYKVNGNIFGSLVVYENTIIFGSHDNFLYNFEIKNNKFVLINKLNLGFAISSTPYLFSYQSKNLLVASNNKGNIHIVDLGSFVSLIDMYLPGDSFSSPVVFKDNIFIGCRDNNLYCLSLENS
ncbi:unnamed protein product [Brassicogethes aeneus]|uniref:Beta-alanine-activating enzyme n=1 Tax=Brassicogethes aeneus TaxID=1431903 RepID=A0A9P0BAU0_BRAAE|nr:unnamed protein product [Brassicogethes aeneus]